MTAERSPFEAIEALRAANGLALDSAMSSDGDGDFAFRARPRADRWAPDRSVAAFELPEPDGWTDPLTGTDGPRFWERIVASEEARRRRNDRGVTIALIEFSGFECDGSPRDRERALQRFTRVARVLAKEVRTSDHIARIGPGRFGMILVETDEVSAINFVDRARKACWSALGADVALDIAAGWAIATGSDGLDEAVLRAEARLGDRSFQEALAPREH
jgi:GGDEF domain-containing protein